MNRLVICILIVFALLILFNVIFNKDKCSKFEKKNRAILNKLDCPSNWFQLNYSCYLLSNYISTVKQVNQTCDKMYLNTSTLIYVEQSIELIYAAHILIDNKLDQLLLQLDRRLIERQLKTNEKTEKTFWSDDINTQWKRIEIETKKNTQSLCTYKSIFHNKINDKSLTSIAQEKANLQQKNSSRRPCDKLQWNVKDQNSNFLLLTEKFDSNKSICILSDANQQLAYAHLCEYQLDRCLNNNVCGQDGCCINTETNFTCKCLFLHEGSSCNRISWIDVQFISALICSIISLIFFFESVRKYLWKVFNSLKQWKSKVLYKTVTNTSIPASSVPTQTTNQTPQYCSPMVPILIVLISVLIFIPLIYFQITCDQIDHTFTLNRYASTNISNSNGNRAIFSGCNLVVFGISLVLSSMMTWLNRKNENQQMQILEPFNPFKITDRYTIAAIISVLTFEVLELFDIILNDIREAIEHGIFIKIFIRIFFVISIGFRYYPLLISLQSRQLLTRILAFVYFPVTVFLILPHDYHHLLNLTKINKNDKFFIFAYLCYLVKTVINYCLLILIGIVLARRICQEPEIIIDKYSFKSNVENMIDGDEQVTSGGNHQAHSENENHSRNSVWLVNQWKKFSKIQFYTWEKDFRLTTIVIVTYTIAFIFLFYSTYSYMIKKTIFTNYLVELIEWLFKIDIRDESFGTEIIISAFITMLIYMFQLIHSIQNYKNNVRDLYKDVAGEKNIFGDITHKDIISNALLYPSLIIRYLIGGFCICFHVILFVMFLLKPFIIQKDSFHWTAAIPFISILFIYCLHTVINNVPKIIFINCCLEDSSEININRPYSIWLYFYLISSLFIGIISSIIRLIEILVINVLFLPRVDYSSFVKPLKELDSAHRIFQCFIRYELLYTNPMILQFSRRTQPTTTHSDQPEVREHTAVQLDDSLQPNDTNDSTQISEQNHEIRDAAV